MIKRKEFSRITFFWRYFTYVMATALTIFLIWLIVWVCVANSKADTQVLTDSTATLQQQLNKCAVNWDTCYIQPGTYHLSDSLTVNVPVVANGNVSLVQDNATKPIFINPSIYRFSCDGIKFFGGTSAIDIGNTNIDQTRYLISRCEFHKTTGSAINITNGTFSTKVTIRECLFNQCFQTLVTYADYTDVVDCWVTGSQAMNGKGVFENHGTLTIERVVGVPGITPGYDQYWIANYPSASPGGGAVVCRDVRFGGEGSGFTAVVNFAPYKATYPVIPTRIILDGCTIYSGANAKRRCAIYCEEVPNQILVRNCSGLTGIPAIMLRPTIDATYFNAALNRGKQCLAYHAGADNVELYGTWNNVLPLPSLLQPFQVP